MDGDESEFRRQKGGIRQGCPLSPYLFILVMHAIFHDTKSLRELERRLKQYRVVGSNADELLYADDTLIFSQNPNMYSEYLRNLVEVAASYGLKLNEGKCENIRINADGVVRFPDNKPVKLVTEAKYLGCDLNHRTIILTEVNKRISKASITWKRLEDFWKACDCEYKFKLLVYNSVITSSLLYGLEGAQLTDSAVKRPDSFFHKGVRQILGMSTTYGAMVNKMSMHDCSDKNLMKKANKVYTNAKREKISVSRGIWRLVRSWPLTGASC